MHGEVSRAQASADGGQPAAISETIPALAPLGAPRRPTRHAKRWCAIGVVLLPMLQAFVWSQYNHIVSADEGALIGGDLCDCQATVARWVNDYFWTQMIWLPANTLVLLIWGALAFKLWGRHFGPRQLTRS